ncbi:MAG: polyprenyl synthetase family protein [Marinicella sp.]
MKVFEPLQHRINQFLAQQLESGYPNASRLKKSMAYSLLSGGKRVRPLLVYATAECAEINLNSADFIAAALEMIHAYSLIHDDLPAMDNDELRRGKATNHIAFDEATAILAGDALQSLAFETLCHIPENPTLTIKAVQLLAQASGLGGMAGGQSLDLISENKSADINQLQNIHAAKTGAILKACVTLPLTFSRKLGKKNHKILHDFADHLGIAFQIVDDILDVTQDTETLGKPAHSDTKNNKSTYPGLLGLDGAKAKAAHHIDQAYGLMDQIKENTNQLRRVTDLIIRRNH